MGQKTAVTLRGDRENSSGGARCAYGGQLDQLVILNALNVYGVGGYDKEQRIRG